MRKIASILLLLVSLVVKSESLTVTIDSYKSASLSGDVPQTMSVTFVNKGGTKGQIGESDSATLTISNWSDATLQSVTLYMKSNKTSGAATVLLAVQDSSWQVADGNFNQWPAISGYTEEFVPLLALSKKVHIERDGTMTLKINGIKNSVYLQKMVVEYTTTPPVSYTVTLQYPSDSGLQQTSISERYAGDGVDLPSLPSKDSILVYQGDTWYFFGWSEQLVAMSSVCPHCWQSGDWYRPEDDITLYALYTTAPEKTIRQDSSCISGEYALVLATKEETWALADQWDGGRIAMQGVQMDKTTDGSWQWKMDTLAAKYRYFLRFAADSVTIQHVATGAWIGHTTRSGSNKYCKWAWHRATDGGVYLFINNDVTPLKPYCLTVMYDQMDKDPYATYKDEKYNSAFSYWRLFPTSDIPRKNEVKYSSLSAYVALPFIFSNVDRATKVLDNNRRIKIRHQNKSYNILGNLLQ